MARSVTRGDVGQGFAVADADRGVARMRSPVGGSVGRVLETQATEMRSKRRQWAREKAGKLPVKIMFPLVGFIFPAILVIVLGPAGSSISQALR